MFEYINGKVTIIESGYIVIDNNGIGYKIYVGSPYSFNIDEEYKVYLYQNIREEENTFLADAAAGDADAVYDAARSFYRSCEQCRFGCTECSLL